MATSPEAFRQVKDILRKLDQSIDSARSRRLGASANGPPTNGKQPATTPATPKAIDPSEPDPRLSQENHGLPQARPLNRAKPLIRDDQN